MFFTIGVHPHHANEINDEYLKKMKDAVKNNNPHAVGETGLDFLEIYLPMKNKYMHLKNKSK